MNAPDENLMLRWHRYSLRKWRRRDVRAHWTALGAALAGGLASWFVPLWVAMVVPIVLVSMFFWWQNRRFEREDLRDRALMFMGREPPPEDA